VLIGDIRAGNRSRCKKVLMSAKSSGPTLVEKLQRQKELEQEQSTVIVELYGHYRNGTFLSVDIVNSAKLKEGEDSLRVVRTFLAFHRYLSGRTRGALASLFSGDGVMCLFKRPQEAVDVAISILRGLGTFNKEESSLCGYLNVRVGIHSGTLLLDNTKDLAKLTAWDMDVARQLQKHSRPGSVLLSRSTWQQIGNKGDFKRGWRKIAQTTVYSYRHTLSPDPKMSGLVRYCSPWLGHDCARYWSQPVLFARRRIVWSLLIVVLAASCFLLYSRWESHAPSISAGNPFHFLFSHQARDVAGYASSGRPSLPMQELTPVVVGNIMTNMGENKYLCTAKIKQGNRMVPLPDKVFLVIPRTKNTLYNRKNGLHEDTVYPLHKENHDRYLVNNYGLFTVQVEILDDYLIFLTHKDAENYLRGNGRG
jgi:class 3 adenylate cyclase